MQHGCKTQKQHNDEELRRQKKSAKADKLRWIKRLPCKAVEASNGSVSRQFRRGVVLVLLLNLNACLPDRTESLTSCQKEADRFFMTYRNDDPENPRSLYIIECMAARGYDFSVEPKACDSRHALTTQPTCYSPHGWL